MWRKLALVIFMSLLVFASVTAQDTCPGIVAEALNHLARACGRVGRNQICYGYQTLTAQPQAGITDLHFAAPGDMEDITRLQSLALSGMNAAVPEWGISLMKIQANLPNSLPGQALTLMLFGNVHIAADGGGATPMQAFVFSSGINDAQCAEAPHSGILVQTPQGSAEVEIVVNGVRIWLNSTAYLEALPGASLNIYLIEGSARVAAFDVVRRVPAGTWVGVPLGGDGRAVAPPANASAYDVGIIQRLNALLARLPRRISIAAALDATQCWVAPVSTVTTRRLPDGSAQRAGRLRAGTSLTAASVTTGADGYRWYQLADGTWAREDGLNIVTDVCLSVPQVAAPLPTSVPAQTGSSTNEIIHFIMDWNQAGCPSPIPAGSFVWVAFNIDFPTEGEALGAYSSDNPVMTINGVNLPLRKTYNGAAFDKCPGRTCYFYSAGYMWERVTPGNYSIAGTVAGESYSCQVTVTP